MGNIKATTFSAKLTSLVGGSKVIRSPKMALEAMFQVVFNNIPNQRVFLGRYPRGYIRAAGHLCHLTDLSKLSHDDLQALKELAEHYMGMVVTSEPYDDILSDLYDPYLGDRLGQFFTPKDIARLVGALSAPPELLTPHSVSDSCSGGGALSMSFLHQVYADQGRQGVSMLDIHAQDLDGTMCLLTAMQITLSAIVHDVPFRSLIVVQGNALTLQDNETVFVCVPDCKKYFSYPNRSSLMIAEQELVRSQQEFKLAA